MSKHRTALTNCKTKEETMHALLNSYSHGYIAAPIIDACQRAGLFAALDAESWTRVETLAARSHTRIGYLRIALRLLHCMGWIACRQDEQGKETVRLTNSAEPSTVPTGLCALFQRTSAALATDTQYQALLANWLAKLPLPSACLPVVNLMAGPVLAPLLYYLHQQSHRQAIAADPLACLPPTLHKAVTDYFLLHSWATSNDDGASHGTPIRLTGLGQQLIAQAPEMGIALSYQPLMAQLDALLTSEVPTAVTSDAIYYEQYCDLSLNREASAFRQQSQVHDVTHLITKLFDHADFASQPHYIADMGCGDGRFLRQLYEAIREGSKRGEVLDTWPLTLIGVDLHESALHVAQTTLAGLPHLLIPGDVSDPQRLLHDLQAHSIITDQVLHVRSFLDHDFVIDHFVDRDLHATAEAPNAFALKPGSVYVDASGAPLAPYDLVRHWRAHLERWAKLLNGHGLIVAEAHCLNADWTKQTLSQSENLYFDHVHALSSQYLIDAELFLVLAANVGLFADTRPQRYPRTASYCNATLNHFRRRDYRVRHAHLDDLWALSRIEDRCWLQALRTPVAELRRRISDYPQGQFVLEWHGRIAGVIYTQRIASLDSIAGLTSDTVQIAHRADGALVQVLAVNMLPSLEPLQARLLEDALLEFMLQRCSVMNGVEGVVAIPLCKGFPAEASHPCEAAELALGTYIGQQDEMGYTADPALQFHQRHGARIGALVPDYQLRNVPHMKHGVLVHYELLTRPT